MPCGCKFLFSQSNLLDLKSESRQLLQFLCKNHHSPQRRISLQQRRTSFASFLRSQGETRLSLALQVYRRLSSLWHRDLCNRCTCAQNTYHRDGCTVSVRNLCPWRMLNPFHSSSSSREREDLGVIFMLRLRLHAKILKALLSIG